MWQGSPCLSAAVHPEEIKEAEDVNIATLRDPQADDARVKKPEWLIPRRHLHAPRLCSQGQKSTDVRADSAAGSVHVTVRTTIHRDGSKRPSSKKPCRAEI